MTDIKIVTPATLEKSRLHRKRDKASHSHSCPISFIINKTERCQVYLEDKIMEYDDKTFLGSEDT